MKRALAILTTLSALALTGCAASNIVVPPAQSDEERYLEYVIANFPDLKNGDPDEIIRVGEEQCKGMDEYGPDAWIGGMAVATAASDLEMTHLTATVISGSAKYLCPEHDAAVTEWVERHG